MSTSSSFNNLKNLLQQYPELVPFGNNKLKCQLSGHEMSSTVDAVETYVNGSKFKRLHRLKKLMNKFGQYFEDRGPTLLYCKITRRTIAKEGDEIERHVNGAKFQRALVKSDGVNLNNNDDANMELDNNDATKYSRPALQRKEIQDEQVRYIEDEEHASDEDNDIDNSESGEGSDMKDFYPELDTSDSCDSDFDFRAMDTDADGGAGSKRKLKNSVDSKDTKKKRSL